MANRTSAAFWSAQTVPTLTEIAVRNLLPNGKRFDVWDASLRSFGVRVSVRGTKTFILKIHNSRRTIGRYPILSLSEARTEAKKLLAEKTLGKLRPRSVSFSHAKGEYEEHCNNSCKASTAAEYKRLLARLDFRDFPTHDEFARVIKKFTSPSERRHITIAASVFFNWCIQRRYITENVALGLDKSLSRSRTRVLTDDELKAVWKATEEPTPYNDIVRLCILSGQRRGELSNVKPEWIGQNTLTIPAASTKNNREHLIPCGMLTMTFLKRCPFSSNSWSKNKTALDKASGVTNWTLHDLRRTFATIHARIGTPPHVIEKLLNHVTGQISGVAAIYNRYSFLPEMTDAMMRYEATLSKILDL
jgi:integrase